MSGGSVAGYAAVAAAITQAIKASGAIVKVEAQGFMSILSQVDKPLVVYAQGGYFSKNYQYLTAYKGLLFFTKSNTQLELPSDTELVSANRIWVPEW